MENKINQVIEKGLLWLAAIIIYVPIIALLIVNWDMIIKQEVESTKFIFNWWVDWINKILTR